MMLNTVLAKDHINPTYDPDENSKIDHADLEDILSDQHHTKFTEALIASLNQTQMEGTEPPSKLSAYPLVHGTDTDQPANAHHTKTPLPASDTDNLSDITRTTIPSYYYGAGETKNLVNTAAETFLLIGMFDQDADQTITADITVDGGTTQSFSSLLSMDGANDNWSRGIIPPIHAHSSLNIDIVVVSGGGHMTAEAWYI